MLSFLKKTLDSPTFMTWGNLLMKASSLLILAPIILVKFNTEQIALWYLFITILSFQLLFDLGFKVTFTRIISYGYGGATVDELSELQSLNRSISAQEPNWETIAITNHLMKKLYLAVAFISFLIMLIGGTYIIKDIAFASQDHTAWLAWGFLLLSMPIILYFQSLGAFFEGTNRIAQWQKIQMLFGILGLIISIVGIYTTSTVFSVVLGTQGGLLMAIIYGLIIKHKEYSKIQNVQCLVTDRSFKKVFKVVAPAAWRSALGIFIYSGVLQLSGIIYSQMASSEQMTSYLIALHLYRALGAFSYAPFSSQIPKLAKLYIQSKKQELLALAQIRMRYCYGLLLIGFFTIALGGPFLFEVLDTTIPFPQTPLWELLGVALIIERYGAMHIQLYSITNKIIWHIANGFSGAIMLVVSILLFPYFDVLAFPVGLLAGLILIYGWYAASHSYREFTINPFSYEKYTAIPTIVIICSYSCWKILTY